MIEAILMIALGTILTCIGAGALAGWLERWRHPLYEINGGRLFRSLRASRQEASPEAQQLYVQERNAFTGMLHPFASDPSLDPLPEQSAGWQDSIPLPGPSGQVSYRVRYSASDPPTGQLIPVDRSSDQIYRVVRDGEGGQRYVPIPNVADETREFYTTPLANHDDIPDTRPRATRAEREAFRNALLTELASDSQMPSERMRTRLGNVQYTPDGRPLTQEETRAAWRAMQQQHASVLNTPPGDGTLYYDMRRGRGVQFDEMLPQSFVDEANRSMQPEPRPAIPAIVEPSGRKMRL